MKVILFALRDAHTHTQKERHNKEKTVYGAPKKRQRRENYENDVSHAKVGQMAQLTLACLIILANRASAAAAAEKCTSLPSAKRKLYSPAMDFV